jgi:hypothetical protein
LGLDPAQSIRATGGVLRTVLDDDAYMLELSKDRELRAQ